MNGTDPARVVVDEFVRARPTPRLAPHVAWYSGYRQQGIAPAVHRGLPSPHLTLIFTLTEPLELALHVDGRRAADRYDSLLGGLHCTPALVTHDGCQSGVQVAVSPLASRALLGFPAGELAGLDDEAGAILDPCFVDRIRHEMLAAADWRQRFLVLDRALGRAIDDSRTVAPEVRLAWGRLRASGGRVAISALADETGWSARHLQNQLKIETGLTPKAAARMIRFDLARRQLVRDPTASLSDIAADRGYFDQSHFAREFQTFAGCTPSGWVAEEFRNVQVGGWSPPTD